jgi:hypothetical protein
VYRLGILDTGRNAVHLDPHPKKPSRSLHFRAMTESTEFHGKVIAAPCADPNRAEKSGKVLIGTEAAQAYGIDDNGRQPPSHAPMLGSPVQAHPAVVGQ